MKHVKFMEALAKLIYDYEKRTEDLIFCDLSFGFR